MGYDPDFRRPDVAADRRDATPIYLQDVMPTTLELAGIPCPEHVQFKSLLPLLSGSSTKAPYDAIYGAYLALQRSVIAEGHKLILYPNISRARLYDLTNDPLEMNDLAANSENAERVAPIVRKLFSRLLALQKETGDALDLKAAFPQL